MTRVISDVYRVRQVTDGGDRVGAEGREVARRDVRALTVFAWPLELSALAHWLHL
jgi:hypothetical protein